MAETRARKSPQWRRITAAKHVPAGRWAERWVAIGAIGLALATAATAAVGTFAVLRSDAANRAQQEVVERGQITDRFTTANDQLASDKTEARLGGIYALEKLMVDAPDYEDPIIEILSAYVRTRLSKAPTTVTATKSSDRTHLAVDVLATLTVLGRRPEPLSHRTPDLSDVHLDKMILHDINFAGMNMVGISLTGVDLAYADLAGARMRFADLTGANLLGANLTDADLPQADLTRADLAGAVALHANLENAQLLGADLGVADLTGANLKCVNLTGADLFQATLTGADLTGAYLTHSDLTGANLSGANLTYADLTGVNLTGVNLTGAVRQDGEGC